MSEVTQKTKRRFDVMVIGDSFSSQGSKGYENFLAHNNDIDVVTINRFTSPLEDMYGIINGDILDSIQVDYIIFQSVERYFTKRTLNPDRNFTLNFNDFIPQEEGKSIKSKATPLPKETILFPFYNICHFISDNAFFSETYKVKTTKRLFSIEQKELLFYTEDIDGLEYNNNPTMVAELNDELNSLHNTLQARGIELIVLPAPDKYDLYYDDIELKERYTEPLFFKHLTSSEQHYTFINTKTLFEDALSHQKDIYYYDDTHWSPIAASLVANKLATEIRNNSKH